MEKWVDAGIKGSDEYINKQQAELHVPMSGDNKTISEKVDTFLQDETGFDSSGSPADGNSNTITHADGSTQTINPDTRTGEQKTFDAMRGDVKDYVNVAYQDLLGRQANYAGGKGSGENSNYWVDRLMNEHPTEKGAVDLSGAGGDWRKWIDEGIKGSDEYKTRQKTGAKNKSGRESLALQQGDAASKYLKSVVNEIS